MRWHLRRRGRDERGAAAVEFALVSLPLIILVFGIVKYGVYFWSVQGGADAARQAARMSAVGDPASCAALRTEVLRAVEQVAPQQTTASGASTMQLTRTYKALSTGTIRTAASQVQVGDTIEITITFEGFDLPLYAPGIQDGTVTSNAVSRVDYTPTPPEPCS